MSRRPTREILAASRWRRHLQGACRRRKRGIPRDSGKGFQGIPRDSGGFRHHSGPEDARRAREFIGFLEMRRGIPPAEQTPYIILSGGFCTLSPRPPTHPGREMRGGQNFTGPASSRILLGPLGRSEAIGRRGSFGKQVGRSVGRPAAAAAARVRARDQHYSGKKTENQMQAGLRL